MDHFDILIEALAKARNQAEEIGNPELIALTENALVDAHRLFAKLGKH